MRWFNALATVLVAFAMTAGTSAENLKLAVTTSFHNSGLSDHLLPVIKADIGLDIHLIVVGTGQALKLARAGDVDAVLVHSKQAELDFVRDGHAAHRREIMYNDFVIIGPSDDRANIAVALDAVDAMTKISNVGALFVSRGDDSGTHRKEVALWNAASGAARSADWYREAGSGMGATLNIAAALNAYVLSDRASWLKFANKGDLKLLFSGDPVLFNQYSFLPTHPRQTHVKFDAAKQLEAWLTGKKGQALIGQYRLNGERLFTPNAKN